MATPDPERITIELRPRPVSLADGKPWPWPQRLRQMLKTIGRAYGCTATVIEEVFPPEPASTPNQEATP